jgi:hypothetical protein
MGHLHQKTDFDPMVVIQVEGRTWTACIVAGSLEVSRVGEWRNKKEPNVLPREF